MVLLKLHMHKVILKVYFLSHLVSLDVKHFVRTLLCTIPENALMILEMALVKLIWTWHSEYHIVSINVTTQKAITYSVWCFIRFDFVSNAKYLKKEPSAVYYLLVIFKHLCSKHCRPRSDCS